MWSKDPALSGASCAGAQQSDPHHPVGEPVSYARTSVAHGPHPPACRRDTQLLAEIARSEEAIKDHSQVLRKTGIDFLTVNQT